MRSATRVMYLRALALCLFVAASTVGCGEGRDTSEDHAGGALAEDAAAELSAELSNRMKVLIATRIPVEVLASDSPLPDLPGVTPERLAKYRASYRRVLEINKLLEAAGSRHHVEDLAIG